MSAAASDPHRQVLQAAVGFRIKMLRMLQPVFKHRRGIVAPKVFLAYRNGRHSKDTGSNGLLGMVLQRGLYRGIGDGFGHVCDTEMLAQLQQLFGFITRQAVFPEVLEDHLDGIPATPCGEQ